MDEKLKRKVMVFFYFYQKHGNTNVYESSFVPSLSSVCVQLQVAAQSFVRC